MKRLVSFVALLAMLSLPQLAYAGGAGDGIIKEEVYGTVTINGKEYHVPEYPPESCCGNDGMREAPVTHINEQTSFYSAVVKESNGVERKAHCAIDDDYFYSGNKPSIIFENGIQKIEVADAKDGKAKTVIIPESVQKIKLAFSKNDTPCINMYLGSATGKVNGQVEDDGITIVFSVMAKEIGIPDDLAALVKNPFCDAYKKVYEEYGDEIDEYEEKLIDQYMEKQNKSYVEYKNVVFYVKSGSYAEKYLKQKKLNVKDYVSVTYNGAQVYSEQPAIISGGRTIVPLRAAFETLGATVNWDNATRTVTSKRGNTEIKLTIGSNQLYVNGVAKTIDVPAQIMNGRTMVPMRAVAEAFGCNVSWDNNTRTAVITE